MLNDFFHPLYLLNGAQLLLFIVAMDMIGLVIARKIYISEVFRSLYWIIGAFIFSFLWFFFHFLIPFSTTFLWISVAACLLLIPMYVRLKPFQGVGASIIFGSIFLMGMLSIGKLFYYSVSLPPHTWDEMAYHYYSPSRMRTENTWDFRSSLEAQKYDFYMMLPRSLDTLFVILFGLTNTYATAQLFQFFIILSVVAAAAVWLRNRFTTQAAIVFSLLAGWLPYEMILSTTTGYIDAAAGALTFVFVIICAEWMFFSARNKSDFYLLCLVGGAALGIKYTTLPFMATLVLVGVGLWWLTNPDRWKKAWTVITDPLTIRTVLLGLVFLLGTGGFWYIKNLMLSGNPLYPLCFFSDCANPLEGWGYLELSRENFQMIVTRIFFNNYDIFRLTIFFVVGTIIASMKYKSKSLLLFLLFIIFGIAGEILLSRGFSLFTLRFFYHWQLLAVLLLVIPFMIKSTLQVVESMQLYLIFTVIAASLLAYTFYHHYRDVFTPEVKEGYTLTDNDIWFVKRKLPLSTWLHPVFPHMFPFITWCDAQEAPVTVYSADPEIIWGWYGLSKMYYTKCDLRIFSRELAREPELQSAISIMESPYLLSSQECDVEALKYEDPLMQQYGDLNHFLVCQAKPHELRLFLLDESK